MKLNLGSGEAHVEGYVNIDLHTKADIKHDLTTPLPYKDNSVDEIRAIHVIEHFTRDEWEFVRKDWLRVLKPKGKMLLVCPNFPLMCQGYLDEPDNRYYLWSIFGLQAHTGEFHKNGFSFEAIVDSFPGCKVTNLRDEGNNEIHAEIIK